MARALSTMRLSNSQNKLILPKKFSAVRLLTLLSLLLVLLILPLNLSDWVLQIAEMIF